MKTGHAPFEKFGTITQADWDTFVAKKTDDNALKLSKERSQLAKKNVHRHTMGSSRYKGKVLK